MLFACYLIHTPSNKDLDWNNVPIAWLSEQPSALDSVEGSLAIASESNCQKLIQRALFTENASSWPMMPVY